MPDFHAVEWNALVNRARATERRLAALARQVPAYQRLQLRRTLDGMELTYRGLLQREGDHD